MPSNEAAARANRILFHGCTCGFRPTTWEAALDHAKRLHTAIIGFGRMSGPFLGMLTLWAAETAREDIKAGRIPIPRRGDGG